MKKSSGTRTNRPRNPFETYRLYESKIRRFVKSNDFDKALAILETALEAEQKSSFQLTFGDPWAGQVQACAKWLGAVVTGMAKAIDLKAIYCEMNRFEINTSQWSIEAFGYETIGDPAESDWLSDWSHASRRPFVLPGLKLLKAAFRKAYEEGEGPPPERLASAELAMLIVSTRMQELIHLAAGHARKSGWLPGDVPVFSAVHDTDLTVISATAAGKKVLERAKREARAWKEPESIRIKGARGPGVYKMDPGHDARGNSFPRDSLHYDGDEELDSLRYQRPLAKRWRAPSMTFRKGLWRSDLLEVYCFAKAVNDRAHQVLSPLLKGTVEWLPLKSNAPEPLHLIHALRHVPLGPAAIHNGGGGRNITSIKRYSFEPADLRGLHLFHITDPPDSPAGAGGLASHQVFVSDDFVRLVEQHGLRGMLFEKVFSLD